MLTQETKQIWVPPTESAPTWFSSRLAIGLVSVALLPLEPPVDMAVGMSAFTPMHGKYSAAIAETQTAISIDVAPRNNPENAGLNQTQLELVYKNSMQFIQGTSFLVVDDEMDRKIDHYFASRRPQVKKLFKNTRQAGNELG